MTKNLTGKEKLGSDWILTSKQCPEIYSGSFCYVFFLLLHMFPHVKSGREFSFHFLR
jgi:hypothetical protein